MTEPALPNDILREIGSHWAGHRLHYTCAALYAWWRPDYYLVTESSMIKVDARPNMIICTTTKRMPNGTYHGECSNEWSYDYISAGIETVEYNRGDIISSKYNDGHYYRVSHFINGWHCYWEHYDSTIPADMSDVIGQVVLTGIGTPGICLYGVQTAPLRDFIAVADALVAQTPGSGGHSGLVLSSRWCDLPPGTA